MQHQNLMLKNQFITTSPVKTRRSFQKQRASKVPIHLHDKVNRLLDILEQYNIISPVNKEEQQKATHLSTPLSF